MMRCFLAEMPALITSALEQHFICSSKLLCWGKAVTLGWDCHIRAGCATTAVAAMARMAPACLSVTQTLMAGGLYPYWNSLFGASRSIRLLYDSGRFYLCAFILYLKKRKKEEEREKKKKEMYNLSLWNSQTKASRKVLSVVLFMLLSYKFQFLLPAILLCVRAPSVYECGLLCAKRKHKIACFSIYMSSSHYFASDLWSG